MIKFTLRALLFITMVLNTYLLYFHRTHVILIIFIIIMLILSILSVMINKLK